jgi:hypothetical protein
MFSGDKNKTGRVFIDEKNLSVGEMDIEACLEPRYLDGHWIRSGSGMTNISSSVGIVTSAAWTDFDTWSARVFFHM